MKELYELEQKMCDDLKQFARNGAKLQGAEEMLYYKTGALKNLAKYIKSKEGGYSSDGSWEATMNGDYSNARHYVRGHYSRDGEGGYSNDMGYSNRGYSNNGYSNDGYSSRTYSMHGNNGEMMDMLNQMEQMSGNDPRIKDSIRKLRELTQSR